MAKKKTGLSSTLFGGIDPYGSGEQDAGAPDAGNRLPLVAIRPDPGQPRRLLPAGLARDINSGRITPTQAMAVWVTDGEQGSPSLAALRSLSQSIARHGLINPVTVRRVRPDEKAPPGVDYYLVTGERRYWAHVLLVLEGGSIQEGDTVTEPDHIRATVSRAGITVRAHQLIENIMREDINAVEKARGLWALRYELSGLPTAEIDPDAPPADLVPWTHVSDEMGISKRYRIFLTGVMGLPPEAQALVQQHGLAEVTIRPIVQKLKERPDLQIEALRQLVGWLEENEEAEGGERRAITRSVKELVDSLLAAGTGPEAADAAEQVTQAADALDSEVQTRRLRSRLRGTLRFLHRLPQEQRVLLARDLALDRRYTPVVDDLRTLRSELDELLAQVADYEE